MKNTNRILLKRGNIKMKKIGTLFIMAFLMLSMVSFVVAEDNETTVQPTEFEDAGITPGNIFYGFDKAMDNIRVSFTFNKERKAERSLAIAEERLAEAEKLTERGQLERADRSRAQYEKFLSRAEKSIEEMETNGNLNKSEQSIRSIARIQDKFEDHQSKISERKTNFLENHAENMTEEELIKLDELFEKFEVKSEELIDKTLKKRDNIETKYKVQAELSDDELENLLEEIDSEEGLKEAREMRKAKDEQRFVREVEVRERNLERMKVRLNAENLTEDENSLIEARILKEEERFEDFEIQKSELQLKMDEKVKEIQESSEEDAEKLIAELGEIQGEIREEAGERRGEVEARRE
jgi:hypothetical protein